MLRRIVLVALMCAASPWPRRLQAQADHQHTGTPPERLHVTATATFERAEQGFKVSRMRLDVSGRVPGMDQAEFEEAARAAEQACPISNALRNNVEINLDATLES